MFTFRDSDSKVLIQFYYTISILIISVLVLLITINFGKFFEWNAIKDKYTKYGLTMQSHQFNSLLFYWVFHSSFIHLFYISILFFLAHNGQNTTHRTIVLIILCAVLFIPILSAGLALALAFILYSMGNNYMQHALYSSYYIGSSVLAWSFIGVSRRYDRYVYLAYILPLMYKLFISGIHDFTPDIAHLLGFIIGFSISSQDLDDHFAS